MKILKRVWSATWRIALFFTLWGALYAPALLLVDFEAWDAGRGPGYGTRALLELGGALAVIAAAWAMVRFVDRRTLRSLGFAPGCVGRDLLLGVAVGSAMMVSAVAILWLAGAAEVSPAVGFSWSVLGLLCAGLVFNSFTQEVLVRGYVLQSIETQSTTVFAVLASSVVFALMHAGAIVEGGVLPAVNLLAAGVLLGLAYTTTRNLWLPVSLHFTWNFLQGPFLGIAVSGQALDGGWQLLRLRGPQLLTGGSFGLEGGLVATLVTAAGAGVLIAFRDRLSCRSSAGPAGPD